MQTVKTKANKPTVEETGRVNRHMIVDTLRQVMQRDNSLSRCCAIRGLLRLGTDDAELKRILVEALLDGDSDVRTDAARALGHVRAESAIESLLANIEGDPEGDVRVAAVKALAEIGLPAAIDGLLACIRQSGYPELDSMLDDDAYGACWEVQGEALEALGAIGDDRATQPLIEILEDDEHQHLHEGGFRVLAGLNDARAVEFLLRQFRSDDAATRRGAAQAIVSIDRSALSAELMTAVNNALADPDPDVRTSAARTIIAGAGAGTAVPASVTRLLNDPDPEVRHEIASLLGNTGGREVVDRLHEMLAETPQKSKHPLVQVLGEIGDPASYQPLHDLLLDCDPVADQQLLYEAVVALGSVAMPGQDQGLAEILGDTGRHYTTRIQAARALGRIHGGRRGSAAADSDAPAEDALAALIKAVVDENTRVSYAAIIALMEIDEEAAVDILVALLRTGVPGQGSTLQAIEQAEADPSDGDAVEVPSALQAMVDGQTPGTSTLAAILAAQSAVEHDAEAQEEPAAEAQGPGEHEKRVLAARLLGNISNPDDRITAALTETAAGDDVTLRIEALLSLGRIANTESAPIILDALNAEQNNVRLAAMDALKNYTGIKEVSARLVTVFEDPDPTVRTRVIDMLDGAKDAKAKACIRRALEDEDRGVCTAALNRFTRGMKDKKAAPRVAELIFKFDGELRTEAAAALRQMNDESGMAGLLEMLNDEEREEWHWVCIDALAERYAPEKTATERLIA